MPFSVTILTLYPEMFPGPLAHSRIGSALSQNLWQLHVHNIRNWGKGKHRAVDDTPAGGGPGMVIRSDILAAALDATCPQEDGRPRICLSPAGEPLKQYHVQRWSSGPGLILVCGRFEGIDARFFMARRVEEISVGDYILSGGESASLVLLDACLRLLPGVLGCENSKEEESFTGGLLEYPHYTRPLEWEGHLIPEVLRSGDHAKIKQWRLEQACRLTQERRPDLWEIWENRRRLLQKNIFDATKCYDK